MANISTEANKVLTRIIGERTDDTFFYNEECRGICLECGEIQPGIEPDAESYWCPSCDIYKVMGIENAVITFG